MALPADKWEKARALFEGGLSLLEIQKQTGIPKGSVGRKATESGWAKNKMRPLQNKEVEARLALSEVEREKATLNATERATHDVLVEKRLAHLQFFETANLLVAKTAANKLQRDGMNASYQDVNSAANAIAKAQDGVLGKEPSTLINNTNASQTIVNPTPEQLRAVNQQLEDAC